MLTAKSFISASLTLSERGRRTRSLSFVWQRVHYHQQAVTVQLPTPMMLRFRSGLCVCLSIRVKCLKSYARILMKFCGEVERDPGRKRLDCDGDLDSFPDPGSFSTILNH